MNVLKNNRGHTAIAICIDQIESHVVFTGKVVSENRKKEENFCDIPDLFLVIDSILEGSRYPDAGMSLRCFKKSLKNSKGEKEREKAVDTPEEWKQNFQNLPRGRKATILLYVRQRRNVTWQGRIYCLDNGKIMNFNSELEFLKGLTYMVGISDIEETSWKKAI